MVRYIWMIPLAAALALGGCQDRPNGKVTGEDVKEKAKDAVDTAAKFAKQKKDEYVKKVGEDLNKMDRQLQDWRAKLADKTADAKKELHKSIDDLEKRRQDAKAKLDEVAKDSKSAWDDLKQGMDKALKELGDAFDKAKDNFK